MLAMRGKLAAAIATALLFGLLATPARAGEPVYYLSLGDSLAASFQPRGPQDEGYSEQLFEIEQAHIPVLQLVKMGCGGETSQAMVDGGSFCAYQHGSQLADALAFIDDHPGQIGFITLTIGSNDLAVCQQHDLRYDEDCLPRAFDRVSGNVELIVDLLRVATGQGVPIVGAAYQDPWIALWIAGPRGPRIALSNHEVFASLDDVLRDAYSHSGALVADLWAAFHADDFTPVRSRPFGVVPTNVALACAWTWACVLGDVHPNSLGYGVLAGAFADALDT
jgi:lysophospholipase L1-like esterase